jgi:hypothetical protein
MKFLLIIVSFLLINASITAPKMRLVHFEYEMNKAKFISQVVIENYDTNGVFKFRSLEFKDTLNSAKSYCIFNRFRYEAVGISTVWVGCNPRINDTVLIVVDSVNTISLFAKLIGNDYRFWDPHASTSGSKFVFEPPVKRLHETHYHYNDSYTECDDGCLLNKDSVNFYKKN